MSKKVLGLIPARGGSKGIPNKNIIDLGGKPLIAWVCETARQCETLDDLIVTTDSDEIASVANQYGVEAPFRRPEELGADKSLVIHTIKHAVQWMKDNRGIAYDFVCLFQPTSPFGLSDDYDKAVRIALEHDADTVISVYKGDRIHPAYTMYNLDSDGRAHWYIQDPNINHMSRRQDIKPVWVRGGTVYVFKSSLMFEQDILYGEKIYAIEMPEERLVDVNTPLDLKIAQVLAEEMFAQKE